MFKKQLCQVTKKPQSETYSVLNSFQEYLKEQYYIRGRECGGTHMQAGVKYKEQKFYIQ